MSDTFDGIEERCKICKLDCRINAVLDTLPVQTADYNAYREKTKYHQYEPILHNITVAWVSRWEVTCSPSCGFHTSRGLDTKLAAELAAWVHLRRWDANRAKEFANNRGIGDLVYNG